MWADAEPHTEALFGGGNRLVIMGCFLLLSRSFSFAQGSSWGDIAMKTDGGGGNA